jgi:prepilin-type N-terminal cleavage/methylation domain-containing protein
MRIRPAPHAAPRAGFTILEVLLAMFVLLIGMTALLGLLSFGAALARTAALRGGAAGAIEAIQADLEEGLFPLVDEQGTETVGAPREIVDRPVPGHSGLVYSAHAVAHPDGGDPLEYRVDVEVRWTTSQGKRSKSFQTLLLHEVPFGERMRRRFVEELPFEKPAPPSGGAPPAR